MTSMYGGRVGGHRTGRTRKNSLSVKMYVLVGEHGVKTIRVLRAVNT